MTASKKQRAELRIVARRGISHALMLRVTLTGHDLYCSVHDATGSQLLRSTYHASGKLWMHAYDSGVRMDDGTAVPLASFRGVERAWCTAFVADNLKWGYRPTPDSPIRRNLLLDAAAMPEVWSVDLWVIEHGRLDLVARTLDSYNGGLADLISYRICDWSQPQLLAAAWTPSQLVADSFQRYADEHLPPGRVVATVAGPGPPIGPIRTVPRPPKT